MKHKTFIIIFTVIMAVCIFLCIYLPTIKKGNTAEIYSCEKLIHKIDLSAVSEPYDIMVTENGHSNTIHVEKNQISVIAADCPDKLCIKQKAIQNSIYPIVCLPNKLIIKINSDAPSSDLPDAISK